MGSGCVEIWNQKYDSQKKVTLRLWKSPGDVLQLTAAVRSLKILHPNIRIGYDGTCPEIWTNNPDIEKFPIYGSHFFEMNLGVSPRRNCIEAYCSCLAKELRINCTPQIDRPVICLTSDDINPVSKGKPYIVVVSGGKNDYTVKQPGSGFIQSICDKLKSSYRIVQIGAAEDSHDPIKGAINLVGQTTLRQLCAVVATAGGGIGGVTALQHIYAALEKPYICLSSGREPLEWVSYPNQKTFSAVGKLPCCVSDGCWKSRIIPLGDGAVEDGKLCVLPTINDYGDTVAKCMAFFSPQEVVAEFKKLVKSYGK